MKTVFKEKVLAVVRKIPKGKTMSYQAVAARAGSPRGSRAVGTIMKNNFDATVPCHRVIPTPPLAMRGKPLSLKTVGEYNRGGPKAKMGIGKSQKEIESVLCKIYHPEII